MRPILAGIGAALAPCAAGAQLLTLGVGGGGFAGTLLGAPIGVLISSAQATSITDLTPVAQFFNGWTADLTFKGVSPSNGAFVGPAWPDYSLGSQSSPGLVMTATSPGYSCTSSGCSLVTISRTIYATAPLRQTYANNTAPTEVSAGGNTTATVALNDFVYVSDTLSSATALAGIYTASGSVASTAASNIPITNSSTLPYQPPICSWVSPMGERVTTGGYTFELFCGHAYGQNNEPVAGVTFTASDGTHSVSHTITAMAQSARLWSTQCTATNGSNVLTGCSNTSGLIAGERLSVLGIRGQPEVASFTSTSITLAQAVAAGTPTTGGAISLTSTPGVGEGLADGGFVGAKVLNANLNGGSAATIIAPVATCSTSGASTSITLGAPGAGNGQWIIGQWITGTNIPIGDYLTAVGAGADGSGSGTLHAASTASVSGNCTGSAIAANPGGATVTSVKISTSATVGVASSAATTVQHTYQGTTGTVTVTLGNPVPTYQVTFTGADLASFSNGPISIRAQAFPWLGNSSAVLDSGAGAPWTNWKNANGQGCDWFFTNDSGTGGAGVCDSVNPAWFGGNAVAGAEKVSSNFHNLFAYYDGDGSYAPAYVWVSGSAGGSPAVQSTSTDPGSGAYYASAFAALANIKTVMSARTTSHNDINGVVFCYVTTGSPYAGFGGAISTSVTANKPGITVTSATIGQNCPASGSANANPGGVAFAHNATVANLNPGFNARINNVKMADTAAVFEGADGGSTTAFATYNVVFSNDWFAPTGTPMIYEFGLKQYYNSFADQSANDGALFQPLSSTVGNNTAQAFGNSIVGGTFTVTNGRISVTTDLGNDIWNEQIVSPLVTANAAGYFVPTSAINGFTRLMGLVSGSEVAYEPSYPAFNVLFTNNVVECLNRSANSPCETLGNASVAVNFTNFVRSYETINGERTNNHYHEDVANVPTVVASGGSLPAGTYFLQFDYALKGAPNTETSTDGPSPSFVVGGTGADSTSFVLPCDPNYVAYAYQDTNNPPTHYATVTGQAGNVSGGGGIPMCQTIVMTAVGGSGTPLTEGPTVPGHGVFKTNTISRFNIDTNFNIKTDTYVGSGVNANGGRVGNWQARWKPAWIGNIAVTGTTIAGLTYPYSLSGIGDIEAWMDSFNPTNTMTDNSWVSLFDNRSFGGHTTTPAAPATNIGQGDYCPSASTHIVAVPAGYAQYPFDIEGVARANDGTGYAGAYEHGCF